MFGDRFASIDDIVGARERVLLVLYGYLDISILDTARKAIFHRKVSTAISFVHPQELPLTQAAAEYHSVPSLLLSSSLAQEPSRPYKLRMETAR